MLGRSRQVSWSEGTGQGGWAGMAPVAAVTRMPSSISIQWDLMDTGRSPIHQMSEVSGNDITQQGFM